MHKMHVNMSLSFVTIEYTQIYYKKLKFIRTGTQTQTVPRVIYKGLRRVDKISRLYRGDDTERKQTAWGEFVISVTLPSPQTTWILVYSIRGRSQGNQIFQTCLG